MEMRDCPGSEKTASKVRDWLQMREKERERNL